MQYDTASLLDWKDWKSVARTYLEEAGEHLDVHEFAQEYLTLVNQFHGWLDATLATHHHSDLQELSQLWSGISSENRTCALRRPFGVFIGAMRRSSIPGKTLL